MKTKFIIFLIISLNIGCSVTPIDSSDRCLIIKVVYEAN